MKVTVKEQALLLDFLIAMLGSASKNSVRKMLKFGRIKVGDQIVTRSDSPLFPGQLVTIGPVVKRERANREIVRCPTQIKHEDDALIVVEKPSGLLSISTDKEKTKTMHAMLYGYMQARENGRVYIVHRLDRDVSGLMVFAKTSEAKTDLQLNWPTAQKRYAALVLGKPPTPKGRIELWIDEEATHKMRVTKKSETSKFCTTEYQTLKEMDGYSLLDINLLTGRRHQIRLSLAHISCPIVGDRVYGTPIPGHSGILLFAYFLRFRHPTTGKTETFKTPIPKRYKLPPNESIPNEKPQNKSRKQGRKPN